MHPAEVLPLAQHLERRSDRARHVRELIRVDLMSGVYGGPALPSESQLALRHSCSRNALREALDLLREEGLVARVPGAGTFRRAHKQVNRYEQLASLAEQLGECAGRVTIKKLNLFLIPAPVAVAERLGIDPGDTVVFFERLLLLDGNMLSVWSSYMRADIAGQLLDCDVEEDFYELIESALGLRIGVGEVSIDVLAADSATAPLLDCAVGAPILHFTRFIRDEAGIPLEYGFVHVRGDRLQLTLRVGRAARGVTE